MNKEIKDSVSRNKCVEKNDTAPIGEEAAEFLHYAQDDEIAEVGTEIINKHIKAFEDLAK